MNPFKLTILTAFMLTALSFAFSRVDIAQAADNGLIRWDIIHVDITSTPPVLTAGGHTSAAALDASSITLTGSGTFRSNPGKPQAVTGGGTWSTSIGGSGNYEVTGFVSFIEGAPLEGVVDDVCDACTLANSRTGLAVLKVAFDDGSDGVLILSCAPEPQGAVFEGITVSKGFVDYFEPDSGDPGNGNATEFHHLLPHNLD